VLTGESLPVEKRSEPVATPESTLDLASCAFMGTVVREGSGLGLVVQTGARKAFGAIALQLGLRAFSILLVRVTAVLAGSILVINIALGRSVLTSVLFALAIAVGLTPQLLLWRAGFCSAGCGRRGRGGCGWRRSPGSGWRATRIGVLLPFSPLGRHARLHAPPDRAPRRARSDDPPYLLLLEPGKRRFYRIQTTGPPIARPRPPRYRRIHHRRSRWSIFHQLRRHAPAATR
jgi:hypothetical protein